MFKPVRVVATIIFLASIGLIFVGAFVIRSDVSAHITITPKIQAHATLKPVIISVGTCAASLLLLIEARFLKSTVILQVIRPREKCQKSGIKYKSDDGRLQEGHKEAGLASLQDDVPDSALPGSHHEEVQDPISAPM